MPVLKPEDMHRHFVEAFNAGNIDALLALYEPEAAFITPRGATRGQAAIREAIKEFLALKGTMAAETEYCIQADDVALLRAKWHLTGVGPDGQRIAQNGNSTEVIRRQPDGRWLCLIDHPLGATSEPSPRAG
jgi:uncharacterized protein (TIGR02246 family)